MEVQLLDLVDDRRQLNDRAVEVHVRRLIVERDFHVVHAGQIFDGAGDVHHARIAVHALDAEKGARDALGLRIDLVADRLDVLVERVGRCLRRIVGDLGEGAVVLHGKVNIGHAGERGDALCGSRDVLVGDAAEFDVETNGVRFGSETHGVDLLENVAKMND